MPLDGIMLRSVVTELQEKLTGGRIDRVLQPENDEIHLVVRSQGENHRLLLSASPNNARIHLTAGSKPNPMTPPMFCMLLRKHLVNAKILKIRQMGMERAVELRIETIDELGDRSLRRLIVEAMGRNSNIILIGKNDRILDSVRRVDEQMSRVREILPGLPYENPPELGKSDPLAADEASFRAIFAEPAHAKLDKCLAGAYLGLSLPSAQEILFRALGEEVPLTGNLTVEQISALWRAFSAFYDDVRAARFSPVLLERDGEVADLYPFVYRSKAHEHLIQAASPSEAVDRYYAARDRKARITQRSANLVRVVKNNIERCQKKIQIQQDTLADCAHSEQYRIKGDLITANLHGLTRGMACARVQNYYSPDLEMLDIPLDPQRTPAQNAQRYYKRYNKLKKAFDTTTEQLAAAKEELSYLEGQLDNLDKCTESDELLEIRDELARLGYLRKLPDKKKASRPSLSRPHHYQTSDGLDVYVGKNNVQNDWLTLRFADGNDYWFHTKNIPGSHVILKIQGREPPSSSIQEAAALAAWYSKGKSGAQVPVDYTPRKFIKKPAGARPGYVIYFQNRTLYITPSEETIKRLRRLEDI